MVARGRICRSDTGGIGAGSGEDGGGATGGAAGSSGTGGGATGGTGAGGTGAGGTGGTGAGGTGGSTGGTGGGASPGTPGCTGTTVAGYTINGTCYYMANKTGMQHGAATSACTALGAGWDLCTALQLCNPSVHAYLGVAGCDCNGGATACACGTTNNLYIQVKDNPSAPYYIRTGNVPNCDWSSDACTDSVSETCGAALCCK